MRSTRHCQMRPFSEVHSSAFETLNNVPVRKDSENKYMITVL